MALNRRLLYSSLAVALVAGVGIGYLSSRDDSTGADVALDHPGLVQDPTINTNRPLEGEVFPDVVLYDAEGNEIPARSLVGQPLVINVWYSTCVPCKDELPAFAAVHAEFGDRVRFVGVNPRDTAETGDEFARDLGVRYELLRDPDGLLLGAADISVFPTTLFVAPDGTIVAQHARALSEEALRTILNDDLLA